MKATAKRLKDSNHNPIGYHRYIYTKIDILTRKIFVIFFMNNDNDYQQAKAIFEFG